MSASFSINANNFNRAAQELSKRLGIPLREVLKSEATVILQAAARSTKAATVAAMRQKINKRYDTREFMTLGKGGKVYYLKNRYPDKLWEQILKKSKAAQSQTIKKFLKHRGLAKQSWFLLARKLGVKIDVPAYAQNAFVTGANLDSNVTVIRNDGDLKPYIILTNASPSASNANSKGGVALQKAISGRAKFFEKNLETGVFTTAQKIAAKYPGLIVSRN